MNNIFILIQKILQDSRIFTKGQTHFGKNFAITFRVNISSYKIKNCTFSTKIS